MILRAFVVVGTAFGVLMLPAPGDRYLGKFIASSVAVLAIGPVCRSRIPMRSRWSTWLPVIAHAGFLLAWPWFFSLGPGRDDLESEGDALVVCIESFRAEVGRFPATLSEAGCAPRWNRFGGWSYSIDGDEWHLSVGDYGADGFILYRYSSTGWEWDT